MSVVFVNTHVAHASGSSSSDVTSDDEPPDGCTREKEHHVTERDLKIVKTTEKHDEKTEAEIKDTSNGVELVDVLQKPSTSYHECKDADPSHGQKVVHFSWVNPKLEARVSVQGSGVFALQDLPKDEHLVVWTGRILSTEQAIPIMDTNDKHYILQVGDGFYQVPLCSYREPADWTNHSCEPNAGFGKGSPICLSSMRPIKAGEQICFDYGMCETDERLWDPMDCLCGTPACRGKITANDWKIHPHLKKKYAGYWSPHVQRLFDEQDKQAAAQQQAQAAEQQGPVVAGASAVMKSTKAGISVVRAKPGKKAGKKRLAGRKKSRGPRRLRIG